jgi:hypothetical protein
MLSMILTVKKMNSALKLPEIIPSIKDTSKKTPNFLEERKDWMMKHLVAKLVFIYSFI